MNRKEEYEALLHELEQTPDALDKTVERSVQRMTHTQKNARKALRIFGIPAGSLAACLVGFMLLVNLFPPFAHACGQIPVLKELAQAVAWSPSLSAAVENEYVQPVEEQQSDSGITATIHYLIVDRKQVNIFYSLDYDKNVYPSLGICYSFGDLEGWAGTSGTGMLEPGKLQQIDLSFIERDVPGAIDLTLMPYAQERSYEPSTSLKYGMFAEQQEPEEQYLTKLSFHLEFDPYFTASGEVIPVNHSFELNGQTLTLTEVELYPTHLRVNLEDAQENISWLEGLDLYVENDRGEQFHKSVNGISASGDSDGEGLAVFWLDSPYFRHSEHLTLCIERAKWKEKGQAKVKVDLQQNTCSALPPNTRFGGAEKCSGGWILHFIHQYDGEKTMWNAFGHLFWDEHGNEYEITSNSSTFGYIDSETGDLLDEDTCFTESFPLMGYDGDTVYLDMNYNQITEFEEPVTIPIR